MNDINGNCSSIENVNCSTNLQQVFHAIHLPPAFISIMIFGILVLLVNGGVFVILIKDKNIRKNPYLFLVLMLCVSDFSIGLGIPCIATTFFIPSLIGNKILTVLQLVLMLNGLCLSLLQAFLISLQRYLVLCKENWNLYIFQQNRKYYVCVSSSIVVVIPNFVLVSPPHRNFDLYSDRFLSYVYHGHYLAHSVYIRFLSLSLLSLTLIFYFLTIRFVLTTYKKVNSVADSNPKHLKTNNIQLKQLRVPVIFGPKNNTRTLNDSGQENTQTQINRKILSVNHKKIVSTLKLVGLLIILLVIFTGPFIFTLWNDNMSAKSNSLVTCLCLLNSLANPFVYLWRLYDIRGLVKSRLRFVRN